MKEKSGGRILFLNTTIKRNLIAFYFLSAILFTTSCVDQNTKIAGDFALSGFDFDIDTPTVSLISTHGNYVNSTTIQINHETGIDLKNCASYDAIAITETDDEPEDADFIYTCISEPNQTLTYNLSDTSEGERTLYLWAKDGRAQKLSEYTTVDFILDTTPPTGSISSLNDYIQGGSAHSLSLSSSDNIQIEKTNLTIAHHASGSWEPISYESGFFGGTNVTFPYVDSSSSNLRYTITDAAGNSTEVISNSFIIDSSAPTLSINNPALFIA